MSGAPHPTEPTDEELAVRAQNGDARAYAMLLERYWEWAQFVARRHITRYDRRLPHWDLADAADELHGVAIRTFWEDVVRRYDPSRGARLKTFAELVVPRSLKKWLDRETKIGLRAARTEPESEPAAPAETPDPYRPQVQYDAVVVCLGDPIAAAKWLVMMALLDGASNDERDWEWIAAALGSPASPEAADAESAWPDLHRRYRFGEVLPSNWPGVRALFEKKNQTGRIAPSLSPTAEPFPSADNSRAERIRKWYKRQLPKLAGCPGIRRMRYD